MRARGRKTKNRKPELEFDISLDRKSKAVQKLVKEWNVRFDRFKKLVPHLAAKYVRKQILEKTPKTEEWAPYRNSLEIGRVAGTPAGVSAAILRSNVRHRRVRRLDGPKTVLYVQPKRQLRRVRPEIQILQKYSPWTLQTLPYMPKRSEAVVISRKVSKREVAYVAKARQKDRKLWRRALDKAGKREVQKGRKSLLSKSIKTIPDIAFEALRLEFGWGGVKPTPHWRPAIRRLITIGFKAMLRREPKLKRALTQLRFREWKKWPPKTRHKIRMSEIRNYLPFQRKLGIRI